MEQMTTQLPQPGLGAAAGRAQRLQRGVNAGVSMGADAFMLIFQNMAEAVNAETEALMNSIQMPNSLEEGEDPFVQLFDQLSQGEDEGELSEDLLTRMQTLAGILMLHPEQLSQLTAPQAEVLLRAAEQGAEAPEQLGTVRAAQTAEQLLADTAAASARQVSAQQAGPTESAAQVIQPENQTILSQAVPLQREQKPETTHRTDVAAGTVSANGEAKAETTIERPVEPVEGQSKSLYDGENQFRSAVAAAKKRLAPQKGTEGKETPAEFQLSGGAVREPTGTVIPKAERLSSPVHSDVSEQISTGAKEQLDLGKTEFVLKLKPESLGEVTVKLTERDGKTTLTILTASPQAAKAINDDLAALRETMRPMAVEVREAVQQTAENAQAQMQQFSMSGQQFAQQQRNFQGASGGTGGFQAGAETEEISDQVLESSGLDTYV